ncbi:hypothetical protein EJ04DRAFT_452171 [Polyplosphaeria fusca]|uniref:Uncharacterized protein n=1 Tax=Polyplosphaeria fusca TaxID=682080 RepID=A0A9P4UVQ2_9PLEO|nr:hypothetical protein EJ04DRAFT_452171 [Polyplosphaeria fusca]
MTFLFDLPSDTSPRLRWLQILQFSVTIFTIIATFLAAVVPSKTKAFTFSLLYGLILSSFTTTFILYREQAAARAGALTKDKYAKYQLYKMVAAVVMNIVAFIAGTVTVVATGEGQAKGPNEQGLWIHGVKVTTWHSFILGAQALNWVFLWASLLYSCCMTGKKQGPIRLGDEESAPREYVDETGDDEAIARQLQAEDRNWQ